MDPGDADDPVVLLGHDAAQRIELEEVADVAAAVGGRGDRRGQAVRERGAIEGDEVDVARGLDVARLGRAQHEPRHYSPSRRPFAGGGSAVTKRRPAGRAEPVAPCGQLARSKLTPTSPVSSSWKAPSMRSRPVAGSSRSM